MLSLLSLLKGLPSLFPTKREDRKSLIIICLLLLLAFCSYEIMSLKANVVILPQIVTRTCVKTNTKVVIGPTKTVDRIIEIPGGERIVERVVYRDSETTTISSQIDNEINQIPQTEKNKRLFFGAFSDFYSPTRRLGIRTGYCLWDTLDLGLKYSFYGSPIERLGFDVTYRF